MKMKSKLLITVALVATLFVGFFIGRFQAGRSWDQFFLHYVYQRDSLETMHHARVLTYLRDGRETNALTILETLLDSSLITFIGYDIDPKAQREASVLRAIEAARDYRTKYPWHSTSEEVDKGIKRVLALPK